MMTSNRLKTFQLIRKKLSAMGLHRELFCRLENDAGTKKLFPNGLFNLIFTKFSSLPLKQPAAGGRQRLIADS